MAAEETLENSQKTTVYFDGLCHLCSREINHYRKMKGSENINFVDITSSAFDSAKENLDPVRIHQSMHVRDKFGQIHVGVDAFIAIWGELPALQFLVPIARIAPVHLLLRSFYSVFAKIRPLLPRKSCETSPYCETPLKR
jgi:predicted DCC family thiol-disulfide oxidoreductase YuxK